MIFKKNVVLVVDAYSTGNLIAPSFISRGFECVHVRSTADVNEYFHTLFRAGDFIKDILYRSDVELQEALSGCSVKFVLAGCEFGVELAAHLAALFEMPRHNDPIHAVRWRDKYEMHEALSQAGVSSIKHFKSDSLPKLLSWVKEQKISTVVLKPIKSAGSDNIHICTCDSDIEQAFRVINSSKDVFFGSNDEVLVQQYLDNSDFKSEQLIDKSEGVDVEYCVNTVSVDGQHYVSEIIRVYRTRIGASPVHDYNQLMCPVDNADVYSRLSMYVYSVLDALGIQQGVGHSELMVVDDQPVLLETAARMPGGIDLSAYTRALGHNQLSLWIDSLINPQAFLEYRQRPRDKLNFNSSCVFLIARHTGLIKRTPNIELWKAIPGVHSIKIQCEGVLKQTISLENCPGQVFILGNDRAAIQDSIQRLRENESCVYKEMLT